MLVVGGPPPCKELWSVLSSGAVFYRAVRRGLNPSINSRLGTMARDTRCASPVECVSSAGRLAPRYANIVAQQRRRPRDAACRKRQALKMQARKVPGPVAMPEKVPQAQGSPSTLPFDSLLNSLPEQAKRRRTGEYAPALDAVNLAVGLVENEFGLRAIPSEAFPPDITLSHIRAAVSRYEDEMSATSERSVCCCCGRLIDAGDIYEVHEDARLILPLQSTFDRCGHHENSWDFCTACHSALSRGSVPKFSASNLVNVITCQTYPSADSPP